MEQGPKSLRVYYRKLWKKKIGGEVFVVTVEENSRIAQLELISRKGRVVGENLGIHVTWEEKHSSINKHHSEKGRQPLNFSNFNTVLGQSCITGLAQELAPENCLSTISFFFSLLSSISEIVLLSLRFLLIQIINLHYNFY